MAYYFYIWILFYDGLANDCVIFSGTMNRRFESDVIEKYSEQTN